MGEGIAIVPENGEIVSPVDGEITMVAPTKHAFGFKGKNGEEILVHVGLETVGLNGEGFGRGFGFAEEEKHQPDHAGHRVQRGAG